MSLPNLKIHVFLDSAHPNEMMQRYQEGFFRGFTTNPTLMAKAGIKDYEKFAKNILEVITDLPISFEVFSDDFKEMKTQALKISSWGKNVNVKIPFTNTKGEPSLALIYELLQEGLKLNVTAVMTQNQVEKLREVCSKRDDVIISVFAGRIADTGVDPMPIMKKSVQIFNDLQNVKILWASPREVLNAYQAEQCGCHIITMTNDLLAKLPLFNKDLEEFSLETVKMFYNDAQKSGFSL